MTFADIALATGPRVVAVPGDLADELERRPEALRFFERLSYSQQQWLVLSVESARTGQTRRRRIDTAVAKLREGRER
jgi:uncharacterized protein YdeI (YjbR/CyaY-like superfamily)